MMSGRPRPEAREAHDPDPEKHAEAGRARGGAR